MLELPQSCGLETHDEWNLEGCKVLLILDNVDVQTGKVSELIREADFVICQRRLANCKVKNIAHIGGECMQQLIYCLGVTIDDDVGVVCGKAFAPRISLSCLRLTFYGIEVNTIVLS